MTYRGYIDLIENSVVHGWCISDPSNGAVCSVNIQLDEIYVGSALCELYRDDLASAGIGNPLGYCGFSFKIPDEYADGEAHQIHVTSLDGSPIPGSPLVAVIDRSEKPLNISGSGLSIVIPTYNRCTVLEQTIRSCMQICDFDRHEFIVVNDGSTDNTLDVLASLALEFPNLKTVNSKNCGPGHARNLGVTQASHDVILFIGDDILPSTTSFFDIHTTFHEKNRSLNVAMLGKTTWPEVGQYKPSFVMQRIQGDGQQQFGYKYLMPYREFPWNFFYTSNISVKKRVVADWMTQGFSSNFTQYGFEDAEFALRMTKKHSGFPITYVPAAVAKHYHLHGVETFLKRQKAAGISANVFLSLHPEISSEIGLGGLTAALESNVDEADHNVGHYLNIFQGLESWACILDARQELGTQNWHSEFVDSVFGAAYLFGYLTGYGDTGANYAAGYRYILAGLQQSLARVVAHELTGDHYSKFTLNL